MEPFVERIVGGGVVLLAGLWLMDLFATITGPWILGAALAVGGAIAVALGVGSEISLGAAIEDRRRTR